MGNAGGDNFAVKGRLMAFDARPAGASGASDSSRKMAAPRNTGPGNERFPKVGGASWTSYALDTARGVVYTPTGNAAPDFIAGVRAGARSLHVLSGRARRAATAHSKLLSAARARLSRLGYRGRAFADHDCGGPAPRRRGGEGWTRLRHRSRDGSSRLRDRVSTIENADAPLTGKGARFCPGVNGGVEWNGPSYSPRTNLLYVGSIDWCTTLATHSPDQPGKLKGKEALPWTGSNKLTAPFGANDSTRRGWLTAIDADNGTIKWRYASPTPIIAGVTATAGDVVFTADLTETSSLSTRRMAASSGAIWRARRSAAVSSHTRLVEWSILAVAIGINSPRRVEAAESAGQGDGVQASLAIIRILASRSLRARA